MARKWTPIVALVAGARDARDDGRDRQGRTRVIMRGTDMLTLAPGEVSGAHGSCPARAPHAISGFLGTEEADLDGDLVAVRSTPTGGSGRS